VYAGIFTREKVDATLDIDGVRFGDAIEAIGWRGTHKAGSTKLSAYFELHIEQGPILEAESKTIGVVTGVQGMRWYEATITGREAHSGSTPMNDRSDSLVTAARLILAVREIADAHGPAGLGTIGRLQVRPNSSNVIPGEVFLTVSQRPLVNTWLLRFPRAGHVQRCNSGSSRSIPCPRVVPECCYHISEAQIKRLTFALTNAGFPAPRAKIAEFPRLSLSEQFDIRSNIAR